MDEYLEDDDSSDFQELKQQFEYGAYFDSTDELANYADLELQDNNPAYEGAFAMLAAVQNSGRVYHVGRRAEDCALDGINWMTLWADGAWDSIENEQNMQNSMHVLREVLPTLQNPQLSGDEPIPMCDHPRIWGEAFDVMDDMDAEEGAEPFKNIVGRFLLDLTVHTENKQEDLTTQFTSFYEAADLGLRADLKAHAEKSMRQSPDKADGYFDLIEKSRHNCASAFFIRMGNMLTRQPHKDAYAAILANKNQAPSFN